MYNSMCFLILFFFCLPSNSIALLGFGSSNSNKETSDSASEEWNTTDSSCPSSVLSGIKWILHIRQPDQGWRENTHRAIIALVLNDWKTFTTESERMLMEQQLEVEITRSLLRNASFPVYPNNLALYIHALIATNRNPRNFHNIDLVGRLIELTRVSKSTVHPFILLALCNAKSLDRYHIDILEYYLRNPQNSRQNLEYKALALQAYECAGSLKFNINQSLVYEVGRYLASQQYSDGSFGNVYTTAIIVQALATASHLQWNRGGALAYLRSQSQVEVNMVSTYLIQLALNAERIKFVKDIHPELIMDRAATQNKTGTYFIQYSLRVGRHPDVHHTINIKVPAKSNFFEIMKLTSAIDQKYNFSYYMDKSEEPSVYAVSNVPNDAEENLYWRLCLQTDINHNRHSSQMTTVHKSPVHLYPRDKDHVIYWYMEQECEETQ